MVDLSIKGPSHGLKVAVVPDVQTSHGRDIRHLTWCGQYIAEKKPQVVVQIGDFGDFPSLSTHDEKGSLALEGTRYKKDVEAVQRAMDALTSPIHNAYSPLMYLTLGNHEDRISRVVKRDPKLEGLLSIDDLKYTDYGWNVYPFLQPIVIGGVVFCHYFPSGVMGRPVTSAKSLLTKLHMSAFAGHQQGRDIAYSKRADGKDLTAIISGSFYTHDEPYLSPFANNHWRGMYFLHEVKDGMFDEMAVSINFLQRRYGK